MESAEILNRGDNLSSSVVMLARGDAEDGGGFAVALEDVPALRLWKVPYLLCRKTAFCVRKYLRHVQTRLVIIEASS